MTSEPYVLKHDINKTPFWRGKVSLLGRLDLELTERCNNNCIHCYINLPEKDLASKEKELKTEEIKNILKEAVSLGCMSVRFTGGEPLLRPDFEELYIFSRKLGLKVFIFTNATLINPHLAETFKHIPPLEEIEVTVYGMKKNSYEAITRKAGSFEAAWSGINLLLEKKIPFVVKGVILPHNKDEIEEFESWAASIPWMSKPPSYSMFLDMRCRNDEAKNKLIRSLRLAPEYALSILTRKKDAYIKEMKEFCSKFMGPSGKKLFSCGSGIGSGCVDAYGNFQPCMLLRHPDCLYSLKRGSLKEALTEFFPKLRELKASNPEYIRRCAKCFLKGLCEQCPGKSWQEHGTLDTPVEYLCEVAHVQARFLGLVKKDEKAWEVKDYKQRIEDLVR